MVQRCQNRHVVGLKHIKPGRKHICQLTFVDKDRGLTFAYRQFGAVFDFVAFTLETPDHCVPCVINPMDNINEFTSQKIEDTHETGLLSGSV